MTITSCAATTSVTGETPEAVVLAYAQQLIGCCCCCMNSSSNHVLSLCLDLRPHFHRHCASATPSSTDDFHVCLVQAMSASTTFSWLALRCSAMRPCAVTASAAAHIRLHYRLTLSFVLRECGRLKLASQPTDSDWLYLGRNLGRPNAALYARCSLAQGQGANKYNTKRF